eukprot:3119979-Amphidinium_carterae.1
MRCGRHSGLEKGLYKVQHIFAKCQPAELHSVYSLIHRKVSCTGQHHKIRCWQSISNEAVSYTHLRAHETEADL